jgi:hypothetical protein
MGEDGGPFKTDPNLRAREEIKEEMNEHREDHGIALETLRLARAPEVPQDGAGAVAGEGRRPKPAKPEHPTLEHGASEADWTIFLQRWERYKRSCTMTTPQEITDQIWGCLSDGLERAAQNDGLGEKRTEAGLVAGIKRLAVRICNTLISQVRFLHIHQDCDEPVASFVARLRGTASLCSFIVTCSSCQADTSYADKIMAHQLVRALMDPVIQEKVLSLAPDGKEMGLKEVISAVEAQEMGKRSQGLLTGNAGLNRVSEYQAGKSSPPLSTPHPAPPGHKSQGQSTPSVGPQAMGPVKPRGRTSAKPWGRTVTNARV